MSTEKVTRSGKKIDPPVSNKPLFNFIQDTHMSSSGEMTKVWTLPPAEMEYLNQSDTDSDNSDISLDDVELYPKCGVGGFNPREYALPNSCVGRTLGFTRRNYLNNTKGQRFEHELIKTPAPFVSRFNFIKGTHVSSSGELTTVWTLPPAEMEYLNQSDTDSDNSDRSFDDIELYPKICIGTQPSNPATGDSGALPSKEQKELLFRSIANLLKKNGLSASANVLMLEAKIKEDVGATPPDIEGSLLEFLKKGESKGSKGKTETL